MLPQNDPAGQHAEAIAKFPWLNHVPGADGLDGLVTDGRITFGSNSGYQAIHLAANMGAKSIGLLGYDYHGNDDHFFGKHPTPLHGGHNYQAWLKHINVLADDLKDAGIEVVNYTRQTAITCFERKSLAEINPNRANGRACNAAGG